MTRSRALMNTSRFTLRLLRWFNAAYALGIAALLIGSWIDEAGLFAALGAWVEGPAGAHRLFALRGIMVVGLAGAAIAHLVLTHLLAMVDSLRAGDPFVARNAGRLQAMAWCVLAAEGLHALVTALVRSAATHDFPLRIGDDQYFRFAPLLAVLMLFVLARVFEQGTRLRDELEGTV